MIGMANFICNTEYIPEKSQTKVQTRAIRLETEHHLGSLLNHSNIQ